MTTSEAARPRLRPLSIGEILDASIKICTANWLSLVKAVLVIVVPVELVTALLTSDYTSSQFDFSTDSSQSSDPFFSRSNDQFDQQLGGVAISTILRLVAVMLAFAACFRMIAQAYLGEEPDWRASLSFAVRRAPALLWVLLLYGLGVAAATVFFLVPGIWLCYAWAFATPALLIEGLRGPKALGRSFVLVQGRWWRTFWVIVVGFILASIVSGIVQFVVIIGVVINPDSDLLILTLVTIAGVVGLALGTPFQAALLTVLYFDLRVRKEGFDLELLAGGIGASVPAIADESATPWSRPPPTAELPGEPDDAWPAAPPEPEGAEEPGDSPASYWPPPAGWNPPVERGDDDPPQLPGVPHG
jgi:hypothetical protein